MIAVEIELERADQCAGGWILEFASSCLAPQCGGDLYACERRDHECVERADRSVTGLVCVELHERRQSAKVLSDGPLRRSPTVACHVRRRRGLD